MKKLLYVITLKIIMMGTASASGLPVLDIAALPSTLVNAITTIIEETEVAMVVSQQADEYSTQIEQYQQQIEAYEQQLRDYNNQNGSYGMGGLLSSAQDSATRNWASDSLEATTSSIINGGLDGSPELQNAISQLKDKHNITFSNDLFKDHDGNKTRSGKYYDASTATYITALSAAESAYAGSRKRTNNIEALTSEIDKATDQKAAIDLNNRLLAQQLHQQNQMIQLLAVQTKSSSMRNFSSSNATMKSAEFNQLKRPTN